MKLLTFFRSSRATSNSSRLKVGSMNEGNLLTVASINATILAITMAAFGIFISLLSDRNLATLERIFLAYRQIEPLFPGTLSIKAALQPEYDTGDKSKRQEISSRLLLLGMENPHHSLPGPNEAAKRGVLVMESLVAIVHHYPFIPRTESLPDGSLRPIRLSEGEQSVEAYRTWHKELEDSVSFLLWIEKLHGQKLLRMVEAADNEGEVLASLKKTLGEWEIRLRELEKVHLEDASSDSFLRDSNKLSKDLEKESLVSGIRSFRESISHVEHMFADSFKDIWGRIQKAQNLLSEMRASFAIYDHYQKMRSPRTKRILIVSVIAFTLFPGIIFPMNHVWWGLSDTRWYMHSAYIVIPMIGHMITVYCIYLLVSV